MAYTARSDRNMRADAFLNNPYKNENYHGSHTGPVSRVPWNTDHARSYSDVSVKSSPAADQCTPTSATLPTSPTLLRSKNQTSRPSVKALTCWYWGMEGHCNLSDEMCLYAHHYTGKMAQAPVRVHVGKPKVAGKNALNPNPVYVNWQQERLLSTDPNCRSEVQRGVDLIKAKTIQNNLGTELQDYIRNSTTMHPPHSNSALKSSNNPRTNYGMLSTQPTMSRQPAEPLPDVDYSTSREIGAFYQPVGQNSTNYTLARQSTQQTNSGHHQTYCPQPIDHLMSENLRYEHMTKYEQMTMMRAKNRAICQFASAIDLAIKTMEEGQKSNEREIQKLIDVASAKIEKSDLARSQRDDEPRYRGGGKLFDSEESCQGDTHAPALAQKRKITGTYELCYDTNYNLPYELKAIAEKLSQTHETAEHNITRLKDAKQMLGIAFENIGDQDVLPQGWIQHFPSE